jgi:hypothetical protein
MLSTLHRCGAAPKARGRAHYVPHSRCPAAHRMIIDRGKLLHCSGLRRTPSWPCCERRGALITGAWRSSKRMLSAYPRSNRSYSAVLAYEPTNKTAQKPESEEQVTLIRTTMRQLQ